MLALILILCDAVLASPVFLSKRQSNFNGTAQATISTPTWGIAIGVVLGVFILFSLTCFLARKRIAARFPEEPPSYLRAVGIARLGSRRPVLNPEDAAPVPEYKECPGEGEDILARGPIEEGHPASRVHFTCGEGHVHNILPPPPESEDNLLRPPPTYESTSTNTSETTESSTRSADPVNETSSTAVHHDVELPREPPVAPTVH